MEKNYDDWMTRTIESERSGWFTNELPELDGPEEYYQTSAPVIIFEMINQHLKVTDTIHKGLTFNALVLSIRQLIHYGLNYRNCIVEFKEKQFKNRRQVSCINVINLHKQTEVNVYLWKIIRFVSRCHYLRHT